MITVSQHTAKVHREDFLIQFHRRDMQIFFLIAIIFLDHALHGSNIKEN